LYLFWFERVRGEATCRRRLTTFRPLSCDLPKTDETESIRY
jgi:hypothetical protein